MGDSLKEHLSDKPDFITSVDDSGNTALHSEALAGNVTTVKVLLEFGASPSVENVYDQRPSDLAKLMGWDHVLKVLPV